MKKQKGSRRRWALPRGTRGPGTALPLGPRPGSATGRNRGAPRRVQSRGRGRRLLQNLLFGLQAGKTFGSYFPCTAPLRAVSCGSLPLPTLSTRFPSPAAALSQGRCPGSIQPPHWGGRLFPLQTSLAARWDRTAGFEAGGSSLAVPTLLPCTRRELRPCEDARRWHGAPGLRSRRPHGSRDAEWAVGAAGHRACPGADLGPGALQGSEITREPGAGHSRHQMLCPEGGQRMNPGLCCSIVPCKSPGTQGFPQAPRKTTMHGFRALPGIPK